MEVATKTLLHQQVKIRVVLVQYRSWKCVPIAISGGVVISEILGCNLLQSMVFYCRSSDVVSDRFQGFE